ISYFIADSRLLYNISNEFYLYRKKLDPSLNSDKLFAIITFKNIYPDDFASLNNNEGHLYKIINTKAPYVNQEILKIDEKIKEVRKEIEILETTSITNIQ